MDRYFEHQLEYEVPKPLPELVFSIYLSYSWTQSLGFFTACQVGIMNMQDIPSKIGFFFVFLYYFLSIGLYEV